MVVLFGVFCLGAVVVIAVGMWAYAAGSAGTSTALSWLSPVGWGRELARRTNPILAGLLAALAGTQAVFLLGLPMGWSASGLEDRVDKPAFDWIFPRVHDNGFTGVMKVLTKQGNIFEIRVMCVVAAIALGIAWRRYFYVPAIVILATFILEKFMQKGLAKIIDRGHPPTTLGTYPSGGCARLISIVGVMVFLALLVVPNLSRRWRFAVWTLFAFAVWGEAFSRTYLSKHWLTDAIAGVVLGVLLLLSVVCATAALTTTIAPAFGGSVALIRRSTVPESDESAATAAQGDGRTLAGTSSQPD